MIPQHSNFVINPIIQVFSKYLRFVYQTFHCGLIEIASKLLHVNFFWQLTKKYVCILLTFVLSHQFNQIQSETHPHSIWLIRRNLEIYKNKLLHKYWQTKKLHVMKKVKIFLHIYVYVIHIMQYACIGRKKLTLILWWKLFPPFCAFSNWIFWHTLHPYPVLLSGFCCFRQFFSLKSSPNKSLRLL